MLEQYENEIKKLEKYLTTFYGNTSSVRMKKYAIEKKIAKYQDIVDEMNLILAIQCLTTPNRCAIKIVQKQRK